VCSEAGNFSNGKIMSTISRRCIAMTAALTIHMCDFGVLQPFSKLGPSLVRDVVGLSNVQTPNTTLRGLQYA
jgi:hypothetical protein